MLTSWNQARPRSTGQEVGGWETGWRELGVEFRMTAMLLNIQKEKQFGDKVVTARKQGFSSPQFYSHGVQYSRTPQLKVLLILLSRPSSMVSYSRKLFQATLPHAPPTSAPQ